MNIETSLNVKTESLTDIYDLADCLIIDIKTLAPEIYERYTGFHNNSIDNGDNEIITGDTENINIDDESPDYIA